MVNRTPRHTNHPFWSRVPPQCQQPPAGAGGREEGYPHRTSSQGRGAIEIDLIEAMPGKDVFMYKTKVDQGHCKELTDDVYAKISPSLPFVATSLQLAPGIPKWADQRPDEKKAGDKGNCYPEDWQAQWYPELEPGNTVTYGTPYNSTLNIDFYGEYFKGNATGAIDLQTDAISALNELPHDSYNGIHTYSVDWKAGSQGWMYFHRCCLS